MRTWTAPIASYKSRIWTPRARNISSPALTVAALTPARTPVCKACGLPGSLMPTTAWPDSAATAATSATSLVSNGLGAGGRSMGTSRTSRGATAREPCVRPPRGWVGGGLVGESLHATAIELAVSNANSLSLVMADLPEIQAVSAVRRLVEPCRERR